MCGNGFEAFGFFDGIFHGLAVAVADDPVVIGAGFGGEVLALRGAFGCDVDRRVIHHGTGEANFFRDGGVVDVHGIVKLAAAEIMAQTECVADFVQREVVERFFDEAADFDAVALLQTQHGLAEHEAVAGAAAGGAGMRIGGVSAGGGFAGEAEVVEELLGEEALGDEAVLKHNVSAENFSSAGIGKAGAVTAEGRVHTAGPAQDVVLDVASVPLRVVGLLFDNDGIFETGGFEGFVPFQHGGTDGIAELHGRGVFDPEGDRFDRFAQGRAGLLLHEVPAVNHIAIRRDVGTGHVGDLMREVAEARVIQARFEVVLRHGDECVLHLHADVTRVGDIGFGLP